MEGSKYSCYRRSVWISGILDLKQSWNPLHSTSQPRFSEDRHLNHLFKSNSFSVIAYFTLFYMMHVCGCYGWPSWISGTPDLKKSWNPLYSTSQPWFSGNRHLNHLFKSHSFSVIVNFTWLWGMHVVAMGGHLGFQVS